MNKIKEFIKNLKEKKRLVPAIIVAVVLLAVVIGIIIAISVGGDSKGKDDGKGNEGGQSVSNAKKITYNISLKTIGGMAMSDIDVYVYADDTLKDLKSFAATDENGSVSFSLPENKSYAIALSGVPKGYDVKDSYSFDGEKADIVLTSSLITEGDISNATLAVGDVMYDMTVKTSDGEELKLSDILKEKKMIMLNFWYTTCQYCVEEFPYMEEAYQLYKDDIEIIALNHLDDEEAIKSFKSSMQLSFPMAKCASTMPQSVFNVAGWPTSIIIDRYGVICMFEAGGITSLRPFVSAFDHFTAEEYEQKLCANGISDLVTNVKPTYTMDTSENIGAAINKGDITVTYRPETDDSAEYAWPFIIGEKDGEKCIYASNQQIEGSFAIIYADVELKSGQAICFDYLSSTERASDALVVIVNGEDIYQISGADNVWRTCYPWVAEEDGTYELALCYIKDEDTNEGDDTVYIKNMRVVSESEIDSETYIPREAATTVDGFEYSYVDIVFNETDGYYHVGSANGPLLLADLMNYTQFNEEKTVFDMISEDMTLEVDGVNLYEAIVEYCSYASNSNLTGICTVSKDLADYLKKLASVEGFEDDENEWLKWCRYYQAYGTNGKQLEDPIIGLAPFCALKAKLGTGIETNYFYYDRAIIPRGKFAEFIPETSGVYRITSKCDTSDGVEAWIFDENKNVLLTYEHCERMYEDTLNCSMLYYMEAGKPYYINIAHWDVYGEGSIYYDIEYVGANMELFRVCAPGYFTYDSNATGEDMYYVISGGIDVVLGNDGKYHEDMGNGVTGSLIYADFTGTTGIFNDSLENMIDKGAFDFTKTENDLYVLTHLKNNNNDVEATDAYLKELWGEDYDGYAEQYQLEDVFAGRYHGTGEDLTEEIRTYLTKYDASGVVERQGCVEVDERLAEILQLLMDKYTFEDVDNSWIKLCYYYDDLKANVQ